MDIQGKVAVVTGAAGGIGRATALALAHAGASVVVVDIDLAGGAETVRLIEAAGGRAVSVEADVSKPSAIRHMLAVAEQTYGGVDILHNNAGTVGGSLPPWPGTSLERIAEIVGTNLAGMIMGTRAALDSMQKRGGGVVVNTGALGVVSPLPYEPIYVGSKAGIPLFTQSCQPLKESHNVRVNCILPAFVDTPILARLGDGRTPPEWLTPVLQSETVLAPEDVAAVVIDLIRDDNAVGEVRLVAG